MLKGEKFIFSTITPSQQCKIIYHSLRQITHLLELLKEENKTAIVFILLMGTKGEDKICMVFDIITEPEMKIIS